MSETQNKKKKKDYWTKEQEEAVAKYLSLEPDSPEAEWIFEDKIYHPLKMLVENIMFTYKLTMNDVSVEEQVTDAMSFVVSKMHKFKPELGHKSFSYYGTVAKNYMIAQKNKGYKRSLAHIDIDSLLNFENEERLHESHEYETDHMNNVMFFAVLADRLENMIRSDMNLDNNVYKVSEVIVYLLRNYQFINVLNKRQFYLLAREFTGMNAKEITKALKQVKEIFKETSDLAR